jgi:hypothetical protein
LLLDSEQAASDARDVDLVARGGEAPVQPASIDGKQRMGNGAAERDYQCDFPHWRSRLKPDILALWVRRRGRRIFSSVPNAAVVRDRFDAIIRFLELQCAASGDDRALSDGGITRAPRKQFSRLGAAARLEHVRARGGVPQRVIRGT